MCVFVYVCVRCRLSGQMQNHLAADFAGITVSLALCVCVYGGGDIRPINL